MVQPQGGQSNLPALEASSPPLFYDCGEAEDRKEPSRDHFMRHIDDGTKPCPKSMEENEWWRAERRAGRPLPDWEPIQGYRSPGMYTCGDTNEREFAVEAHYNHHINLGEVPCPKSRAEAAWKRAERRAGYPLPDWEPKRIKWFAPTYLYRIVFHTCGSVYWGVTCQRPETRWAEHRVATTPLGKKLRADTNYTAEVVALYMDRRTAEEQERRLIEQGNPFGPLLNVKYNPDRTALSAV